MTSRRASLASAVLTTVLTTASVRPSSAQELAPSLTNPWRIAGAFPQSTPGPLERRANAITPENPIPRRTHLVRPTYPAEAAAVGARATVALRITVDELGHVGEVRTVGIPVVGAMTSGGPDNPRAHAVALGALVESAQTGVSQWLYEPPAEGPIAFDVTVSFDPDSEPEVAVHGQGFRTPPRPVSPLPTKTRHVSPVYPAEAREAGLAGVVLIEASVDAAGRVIDARILRSIPLLDQAALDAVKQWEYTPTLVNGMAMPARMIITIQFSLP
jgi:TonB family protein